MKRYTVVVNGVTTILRLSDRDAAARGLTPDQPAVTKAKRPANKGRTPSNKHAEV